MTFRTEPLAYSEDAPSDHTPSTSRFAQALKFFDAVPVKEKAPQKVKNGERSPFLSFRDEPLVFPANESHIDFVSFFEEWPDLTMIYHSDYEIFLEICQKGKPLPARQYAMATVIRRHGGFDLHIREELPKKYLSHIGDVTSFIRLFPNGVPGISKSFIFYLGDIDIRLQWSSSKGWDIYVARSTQTRQIRNRGSKILYPLITTKR